MEAIQKLICRNREQIPDFDARAKEFGLTMLDDPGAQPSKPPLPETQRKLELLQAVKFNEPRKVGKRVFDDSKFVESLRQQVVQGKGLSPNQISYLDRLVMKYSEQIPDLEKESEALGLNKKSDQNDTVSGPLLEALKAVTEWKPAVKRGRREWDDRKFYESLSRQFMERRQLSEKQVASLKKLVKRYAGQVADYESLAQTYGLPPATKPAPETHED